LSVNELEHAADLLEVAHCQNLGLSHALIDFLNEIVLEVIHRHRVKLIQVHVMLKVRFGHCPSSAANFQRLLLAR